MTSLTVPPTVSFFSLAAVWTAVSQVATEPLTVEMVLVYQLSTASSGIRLAGEMSPFQTGWILRSPTPGMASTFSR